MFTTFKQNQRIVFLDPRFEGEIEYDKKSKISLILSPSLYWVKKVKLPVKSVREVKKLLASLFEDSLPEGNYSYSAYKIEDAFLIFAYEDKKILELLSSQGIPLSLVRSIHFAQSELSELNVALKINESEAIYLKDGLLLVTPLAWVGEFVNLDLEHISLSKHKILLQQFGHIVDKKSLYKIAAIALVLIAILLVEIFITTSKIEAIVGAKEKIFTKYKLQPTMMQNRSTKSKYSSIYAKQTKVRKYIAYFLNMKLEKSQKITLIEYKNREFRVSIEGVEKQERKRILSQIDAKGVKYKSSFKEGKLRVEMKI